MGREYGLQSIQPTDAKKSSLVYVPTKPNFKEIDALYFRLAGERRAEVQGNHGADANYDCAKPFGFGSGFFFSTWTQYEIAVNC